MRRRRHPARRARRVVGTISVGAYATVGVAVGLAQRASETGAEPEPTPPTEPDGPVAGIQRVDLAGSATFVAPPTSLGPTSVPVPPPPPSVIVTTTVAPTTTVPRPVAPAPPPTIAVVEGPSPSTPVAAPTPTVAPTTTVATTTPPTTTQAPMPTIPPTTVPNGAS